MARKGQPWLAFCLLGLVSLLFLAGEVHNGRLHYYDFEVYYKAGARVVAGENLYRPETDGFYEYLYSPPGALYFAPISLLPFPVAKVVYWVFLTTVVLLGFCLSVLLVCPEFRDVPSRSLNALLLVAAIVLGVHIQRELHLGQVNHLLLVMYLGMAWLFTRKRPVALAAIWAASIFIKPLALIFVPYFMVKRRYRELAWFVVIAALIFLLPLFFYGRTGFWDQYRGQIRTYETEALQKVDVAAPGNYTLSSVIVRYSPLRLVSWPPARAAALSAVVVALACLAVLWLIRRGRHVPDSHVLEFAALVALIPLLSATSYNAYGFLELAVFLLLFRFRQLGPSARACAVAGMVLSGGNWSDLWGRRLWFVFDHLSLVAVGGLILCGVLWKARADGVS